MMVWLGKMQPPFIRPCEAVENHPRAQHDTARIRCRILHEYVANTTRIRCQFPLNHLNICALSNVQVFCKLKSLQPRTRGSEKFIGE
jgi:hypothetical protein